MCHKGFIHRDLVSCHKGIYVLMDGIWVPCWMVCDGLCSDVFGGGFIGGDGGGREIRLLCECLGYFGEFEWGVFC